MKRVWNRLKVYQGALFKTDRLTEIQVPYISNEQMWDVLKQYEVKKDAYADTYQNESSDDDFDLD